MKSFKFVALTVVLCAASAFAALDIDPAPWRGLDGSTYQSWDFLTNAKDDITPDDDQNPYGTATLTISGSYFESTGYYIVGPSSYAEHDGVWGFKSTMIIDIPNNPVENPYKEVWLQITFAGVTSAGTAATPNIFMLPEGNEAAAVEMRPDLVNLIDLGDGYYHATYHGILIPNPESEIAVIMPAECTLYVDDLIVETICVPEPATVALLCAGLAMLTRKK